MMRRTRAILDRWPGSRVGGFTLVELLAVLIMLAIISAVVVPALTSVNATRQAAAASRLVRDLQLARQRSVARGVRTLVVVNADQQQYALFIEDPAAPGRSARVVRKERHLVTGCLDFLEESGRLSRFTEAEVDSPGLQVGPGTVFRQCGP